MCVNSGWGGGWGGVVRGVGGFSLLGPNKLTLGPVDLFGPGCSLFLGPNKLTLGPVDLFGSKNVGFIKMGLW